MIRVLLSSWFRRRVNIAVAAVVLLCCTAPALRAQVLPDTVFPAQPNPPRLVNDFAGVLSPTEEGALERKLLAYEDSTSTQVAVITLRDTRGYDIAEYGTELFNRWRIGQSAKNNGVLLLAAIDDRRANITTGRGAEGALTDITSGRILRQRLFPAFKGGRYYNGLDSATTGIIQALRGEFVAEPERQASGDAGGLPFWAIILIVLVVLIFLGRGGRGGGGYASGRGFRRWGGPVFLPGGFGGGWGGGGFGGGGGGGFGGFGGGSSGGGGASGSW